MPGELQLLQDRCTVGAEISLCFTWKLSKDLAKTTKSNEDEGCVVRAFAELAMENAYEALLEEPLCILWPAAMLKQITKAEYAFLFNMEVLPLDL